MRSRFLFLLCFATCPVANVAVAVALAIGAATVFLVL